MVNICLISNFLDQCSNGSQDNDELDTDCGGPYCGEELGIYCGNVSELLIFLLFHLNHFLKAFSDLLNLDK